MSRYRDEDYVEPHRQAFEDVKPVDGEPITKTPEETRELMHAAATGGNAAVEALLKRWGRR